MFCCSRKFFNTKGHMLHTTTVISRSTPAPSFLRRWTSTLVFLKGTASLEICQIMELQSLMYMIIEPQEHDFIVIHSPTKARTKLSQWFFFSIFLLFFFLNFLQIALLHLNTLVPSIPTSPQSSRKTAPLRFLSVRIWPAWIGYQQSLSARINGAVHLY